tara:strand:- start:14177 stop:15289 length:1113 start_codon:yes stop_codon:yes gene_type:complete
MNYLHIALTFIIVLFIYIHVQFQLTTSDEKDVYVLNDVVYIPMEEVFDLKQPVVFHTFFPENYDMLRAVNKHMIHNDYKNKDIQICDTTRTTYHTNVPSSFQSAISLFDKDVDSRYYTSNNDNFVKTCLSDTNSTNQTATNLRLLKKHHSILVPPLKSREKYDIIFGSDNTTTILQYSIMYRNFFTVTNGTLEIKMIHPSKVSDLTVNVKPDYYNMGFFTEPQVNVWDDNNKDKLETITTVVHEGQTICIPPYWLYSFKLIKDTFVWCASYNTYMTEMATLHHNMLHTMHKFTKPSVIIPDVLDKSETPAETPDTSNLNEDEDEDEDESNKEDINTDADENIDTETPSKLIEQKESVELIESNNQTDSDK